MPSAYAHYRFGRDVCPLLGTKEQETVLRYPELFYIGLHGPDLFFYDHPLTSSPLKAMGHRMHRETAEAFFVPAADRLSLLADERAGRAYLYGFLCHFALDSSCHPYVEHCVKTRQIPHLELESQFDRMLMLHDGLDPLSHFPAGHIIPSMKNAGSIAPLFPDVTAGQIRQVLCSMRSCCRLLCAPHAPKRLLLEAAFALSGNHSSMQGVLISPRANPSCHATNRRLGQLYRQALPLAASLILRYRLFLEGATPLGRYFCRTFD